MRKFLYFSVVLTILGSGSGCSRKSAPVVADRTVATTREVAKAQYIKGLAALKESDFDGAFSAFRAAARGPSYVEYSRLARLRLADTLYYQEMFDEAAEAYRAFINASARDPNLHYAYYRLAESKVKSISGDFFLVPPSDRRDQKKVRSALKAIESFLNLYPDSPFCGQVLAMKSRIVNTVSSFEMEVARFYMSRKKPAGAVGRIRALMKDVPATRDSEEIRAAYVEALGAAGEKDELSRECADYNERFPDGRHRSAVSGRCAKVGRVDADKAVEGEPAPSDGNAGTQDSSGS